MRAFACSVKSAVHTVKALLDDNPALIGTCESTIIFSPFG
jgi:hypothetical protein